MLRGVPGSSPQGRARRECACFGFMPANSASTLLQFGGGCSRRQDGIARRPQAAASQLFIPGMAPTSEGSSSIAVTLQATGGRQDSAELRAVYSSEQAVLQV